MRDRPLLIGIDASRILPGRSTGTERYSLRITEAVLAAGPEHRYRLYLNQQRALPIVLPPKAELRSIPLRRLWTHARLSLELWQRPVDVLFVPAHVVPLFARGPAVVTIHDVGYRYEPEAHPRRSRLYLEWSTRWSVRRAARIIAISESTRDDLRRFYGVPEEKVRVIPHGVDPQFVPQPPEAQQEVRERYGLRRPFVLYLGTIQPRKNLVRLVRAFERLADCMPDLELALGGKRGWLAEPIEQAIACSRHRERIHLLGYIPEEDLPALYSAAAVFTLPSLYEGFGLPALEAMACGVPVVVSNRGALPEIARPALLVDPLDVDALAEGLRQALQPDARQRLVAAGLEHARRFRWEVAGRATLEVLEEAARSGRRRSEA
ncbi:glycosyltransferase family 4 protein [Thermomicrobiaceae bacterium CFH 74404]|uniref:Glycosyltransferase family 4 protein n=1 Tax=Thermalbibacter longus TaxID=2951981 RepID=A0AA42B9C5_9BACT|nr:glycosyltransferase family 1 protein [Thermalbibacter longus]MCM8748336.1 glycosyltransferase family 4 protein [Thermalbibacter longus]